VVVAAASGVLLWLARVVLLVSGCTETQPVKATAAAATQKAAAAAEPDRTLRRILGFIVIPP
jgi:hypothetical protein